MSQSKFCGSCGNPLGENERFCGKCGAPVAAPAETVPEAAAEAVPEAVAPVAEAAVAAAAAGLGDEAAQAEEAIEQSMGSAETVYAAEPVPPTADQAEAFAANAGAEAQQIQDQAAAFSAAPVQGGFDPNTGMPVAAGAVPSPVPAAAAVKSGGNAKKIIIPVVIIALVAILGVAGFLIYKHLTRFQEIDAKDLFVVEFSGLDGQGKAIAYLNCEECDPHRYEYGYYADDDDDDKDADEDEDGDGKDAKKERNYSKYLSDDTKTLEKAFDKADGKSEAKKMRKALMATSKDEYKLKIEFDTSEGLSNGDTVKCKVKYDEEDLEEANIKLENTEFEVEVTGLIEAEEITDMFEGFNITFSGINEMGTATFDDKSSKYPFIRYDYETSNYNLKNGDSFSIRAYLSYSNFEKDEYIYDNDTGETLGYCFTYEGKTYLVKDTGESKSFTVSGLSEPEEIDIFEGIKLESEGALPYLKIGYSVNTDNCSQIIKDYVSFSIEDRQDFYKAGDTVKIKAYVYSSLKEQGYKPAGTPDADGYYFKEITIEDDGSYGKYILEDATAEDHKKLDEAESSFNAILKEITEDYTGRSYIGEIDFDGDITKFSEPEAYKAYLVKCNGFDEGTISSYDDKTYIVKVYKITATYEADDKTKEKTFYLAVRVNNALINAEGNVELGYGSTWKAHTKLADVVDEVLSGADEGTKTELKTF
ncbi:MAG: zinc ribbon domain-containing protein [Ruminococcus sp.]|nr:zinc ribbon domain-containing protein [Ruminococcus sp.]MBR4622764.1 zinc ribbon domain-containing protein [Ruminococcus sp.]